MQLANYSSIVVAALASLSLPLAAATFGGNNDTGFGGTIGNGSLALTDDGTTLTGTLTTGADMNDDLVIYIDSVSGGFADTSGFGDANDGSRRAISGFDGGANRSLMTFASGFRPDYAISLGPSDNSYGGLWQLANGGNNSLNFINSVNLSPLNATAGTYTFSISLTDIGLTPGAGQSFELFGTYTSNSGYRSTEAIAGNDTGTQGWNSFQQTSYATYTTTVVPEPSTLAICGLSGLATLLMIRRRR